MHCTSGASASKPNFDRDEVIEAAAQRGDFDSIYKHVCGVDPPAKNGSPCSVCGGTDRFYRHKDYMETGGTGCRTCGDSKGANVINAVMWLCRVEFLEALQLLGEHLGLAGTASKPADDIWNKVMRSKNMSSEGARKFGGKPATRQNNNDDGAFPVVRFPMYDPDGEVGHYDITSSGHGLNKKGSRSGIFLPGRKPTPGETWVICEGVKDATRLLEMEYNVAGRAGRQLGVSFARMFERCTVIMLGDLDKPGQDASVKAAEQLEAYATDIRIATLPGPVKQSKGRDVRDFLKEPGGEEAVRKAIDNAKPWKDSEAASDVLRPRHKGLCTMHTENPTLHPAIIEGLIRRGEIANIIAASKQGKSWLVMGMAAHIAFGKDWLGLPTKQGRVLIVDNELHEATAVNRAKQVCDALGLDWKQTEDRIHIEPLRGRVGDFNAMATYFRELKAGGWVPDVIIFDAFYRMLPAGMSENDNAEMTRVYNTLDRYASMVGAAVINVHHSSKGSQSRKAVTDIGSGAGAIARAADCHLTIREHEVADCAVVEARLRSFAPLDPFTIQFKFPVWGRKDQIQPEVKSTKRSPADEMQDKASTMKGLEWACRQEEGYCFTGRQLRDAMGCGESKANRLVSDMKARELVEYGEMLRKGGHDVQGYLLTPHGRSEYEKCKDSE